jgi:hypothetical protein
MSTDNLRLFHGLPDVHLIRAGLSFSSGKFESIVQPQIVQSCVAASDANPPFLILRLAYEHFAAVVKICRKKCNMGVENHRSFNTIRFYSLSVNWDRDRGGVNPNGKRIQHAY